MTTDSTSTQEPAAPATIKLNRVLAVLAVVVAMYYALKYTPRKS
jgi:hypothetical protein